MKVYIVWEGEYVERQILGVFSSKEVADAIVEGLVKLHRKQWYERVEGYREDDPNRMWKYSPEKYEVEEYELDPSKLERTWSVDLEDVRKGVE